MSEKIRSTGNQDKSKDSKNLVKKFAKVAAAAGAIGAAMFATSSLNKETMETEKAKDVEKVQVDGVSIHGGPNLRSEPVVSNDPDNNNLLAKLDDNGQPTELNYKGDVFIYKKRGDANGEWYGFYAEDLTASLLDAK